MTCNSVPVSPAPPSRSVAKHNFPELRRKMTRPVTPTISPVSVSGGRSGKRLRRSARCRGPRHGDRVGLDALIEQPLPLLPAYPHLLRQILALAQGVGELTACQPTCPTKVGRTTSGSAKRPRVRTQNGWMTSSAGPPAPAPAGPRVLPADSWRESQTAHEARVDALIRGHLDRARRCRSAPGRGLPLHLLLPAARAAAPLAPGRSGRAAGGRAASGPAWRFHRVVDRTASSRVDVARLPRPTRGTPARARPAPAGRDRVAAGPVRLLRAARVGDGLPPGRRAVRHAGCRCGSGAAGTDAVVESHRIRCSHYDAFRFFTAAGARRGTRCSRPGTARSRSSSPAACTRRWTSTSGRTSCCPRRAQSSWWSTPSSSPATIRELDMRASPYDLTALGLRPRPDRDARGQGRLRRGASAASPSRRRPCDSGC